MALAQRTIGLATMVFDKHGRDLSTGKYTMMMSNELHPLSKLATGFKRDHPNKKIHRQSRLVTKKYDLDENPNAKPVFVPKSLEPNIVLKLLPKILLARLLADPVLKMAMNDGMGSEYDARTATVSVKGTHDFYHEIGHHAWSYYLPKPEEVAQRDAIIAALPEDRSTRHTVPMTMVPQRQRRYSQLVGGYDGQRLAAGKITRATDLDEHFARNFDYLIKRKPISVLPGKHDLPEFLKLYMLIQLKKLD